jgi:uncharacterized protein YndB with AHSA1/START domain
MKVELQSDTIVAEVDIEASAEIVFAALVDPKQLPLWWGTADSYSTKDWQIDPRPGGKWSVIIQSAKDGSEKSLFGIYEEFDPPRALTFTWNIAWEKMPETRVRITLESIPIGTRLRLVHSGFGGYPRRAEEHTQGWTRVLGWLDGYARAKASQKN